MVSISMYSKKYICSTEVDVYVCVHKWTVSNPQAIQQIVYVCDLKGFHVNTNELDKPLYRQVCCVYV